MAGAIAVTNFHGLSSSQVGQAAALRAGCSRQASFSRALWQAARRDKIAGRECAGIALLQWGAQVPNHYLCALAQNTHGHGRARAPAVWPFLAMPAFSLTIMCVRVRAGASEASSTIGSVVEDVETDLGASSVAAFALELTWPRRAVLAVKSAVLVGGSVCDSTLRAWV